MIFRQIAVIAQLNIVSHYNHIQKMAWILNKTFTVFKGEDGADPDIVLTPRGSHKPRQYLPAASKRYVCQITLLFQLEDTVRLFGTLLLLDPIHFPKSEPCLIIGSVCQIGALLGTSLYV